MTGVRRTWGVVLTVALGCGPGAARLDGADGSASASDSASGTDTGGGCEVTCPEDYTCVDGECVWEPCLDDPACCGEPCCVVDDSAGSQEIRCETPDCSTDADCPLGQVCVDSWWCEPAPPLPLCDGLPFLVADTWFLETPVLAVAGLYADGDDREDVALVYDDGLLQVRRGELLAWSPEHMTGLSSPGHLHAGDLDGDGDADLFVGSADTADGMFALAVGDNAYDMVPFLAPWPVRAARVHDMNADGITDVVAVGGGAPDLAVFILDDTAGVVDTWSAEIPPDPVDLAVGRFVQGEPPHVAITYSDAPTTIVLNAGDGLFGVGMVIESMPGAAPRVVAADLAGEGQDEIVSVFASGTDTALLVQSATDPAQQFLLAGSFVDAIIVLDANGDGLDDLAVAGADGARVVVAGTGEAPLDCQIPTSYADPVTAVAAADVNGGGLDDLLVITPGQMRLLIGEP